MVVAGQKLAMARHAKTLPGKRQQGVLTDEFGALIGASDANKIHIGQIDIGAPLLLHLQFHPSVVCMRQLYDSTYPIALLDNELELSNEGETNQSAINLSRIAFSMGLDYLFYHLRSNEECKFKLDSVQVDYLIKDENGIVKLYFSGKNSSWKEEFSQLLINQKPVRFHRFGAHIRKAMETCDNGSFEQIMEKHSYLKENIK